ncbi:MAG: HAD-IIIA family hydrolase [Victivallales bacterium]|nr:HAD-IIIA family hydrolase [Victivallales bacterium]
MADIGKSLLMFDLDGTVADTCADLAGAVNHVRAEHGLAPLSVETVTSLLGNGLKDLTTRTFADAPPFDVDAVMERVRDYYWSHVVVKTCLYDGVLETLAHLKEAGYKLSVITNKPEGPAKTIMDTLGVSAYLDCLIGGGHCAKLKPDPEPLFAALKETECEAASSWIIGDNWTDLGAAANAGVKACFCTYGYGSKRDFAFDVEIASFRELENVLLTTKQA